MALSTTMQKTASGRALLQSRLSVDNYKTTGNSGIPECSQIVALPKVSHSLDKENTIGNNASTTPTALQAQQPHQSNSHTEPYLMNSTKTEKVEGLTFQMSDFELGKQLGEGLLGEVRLARTRREKKVVAIKKMAKCRLEQEGVLHQLKREVEIHSRLRHPNIVRMYSYFHDLGNVYLVLEYCPNGTLYEALQNAPGRRFNEDLAASIIGQLCSALSLCHRFQIFHRDVKPENILLGKNNEVKLADFGWAVANRSRDSKMSRETLCGTVEYLAPEMVEGLPYDERVDAWSVGVLLFEMLIGHPPFRGPSQMDTFEQIAMGDFAIPPMVSHQAQDLISRLLMRDPEQRMSVEEVATHPWIIDHALGQLV